MRFEEYKSANQWIRALKVVDEFPTIHLAQYAPFAIVKAFYALKALQEKYKVKKLLDKVVDAK